MFGLYALYQPLHRCFYLSTVAGWIGNQSLLDIADAKTSESLITYFAVYINAL